MRLQGSGPWLCPFSDGNPVTRAGIESILNEFGIKYFIIDSHLVTHGRPLGAYKQLLTAEEKIKLPEEKTSGAPTHRAYLVGRGRSHVTCATPLAECRFGAASTDIPATPHTLNSISADGPEGFDTGASPVPTRTSEPSSRTIRIALRKWHRDRRGISSGLSSGPSGKAASCARRTMRSCSVTGGTKGAEWLKECYRLFNADADLKAVTLSEDLAANPPEQCIELPSGSWGEGGGDDVWLNPDTSGIWKTLYSLSMPTGFCPPRTYSRRQS